MAVAVSMKISSSDSGVTGEERNKLSRLGRNEAQVGIVTSRDWYFRDGNITHPANRN